MVNNLEVNNFNQNISSSFNNFSFIDDANIPNDSQELLRTFNRFIENGGDINIRDKDGRTILHVLASIDGVHEQIFKFIKNKADLNISDNYGQTPLHISVKNGIFKNTAVLLNCSADVNAIDKNANTPLDLLPEAKIKYKMIFVNELNNRENFLMPDVVVQYVPSEEDICKVYGKILDFGDEDIKWITNSQKKISVIYEDISRGNEYNSMYTSFSSPIQNYVQSSEPNNTINNFKVKFAKYILSWGGTGKPDTLDKLFDVKKKFIKSTNKYSREFDFSFESIKPLSVELSKKRLLSLKRVLNKKGIPIEISEFGNIKNIADKISFLVSIHFQNELLTKEQLNYPLNHTYKSRMSRHQNIRVNIKHSTFCINHPPNKGICVKNLRKSYK